MQASGATASTAASCPADIVMAEPGRESKARAIDPDQCSSTWIAYFRVIGGVGVARLGRAREDCSNADEEGEG